ncbi:hypothetical protein HBI56_190250 [Parastagonospora nodorum]|uniref:Uncharacterized protein n=1 Tax=Phaeosphaeria nodorum (strain SN15 / ATCC MYA-4574 / FGSC 10173) TaxID=321614 RepID=A0A7U2F9Y0_PHANO|nr:hypothetical protein HBH56_144200 [Parastagonospora nodorum]QRD01425.1 hypothetical protein JI435_120900 [Parastagonospora nodorum SN15]KAH3927634.1 hypothetical protein HBH54_149390 [Parastagonospora nodorum]KAH3961935.1 hypothetical protein HBH51_178040 [Parastagonospora nodorum]KAH3998021.1 hypothetical protein HBI10_136840 [Parastagonospora nodorum]
MEDRWWIDLRTAMSEFGKTAAATGSRPAPRSRSPSRLSQLCRRPSLPWLPGHEEGIMYFDSVSFVVPRPCRIHSLTFRGSF